MHFAWAMADAKCNPWQSFDSVVALCEFKFLPVLWYWWLGGITTRASYHQWLSCGMEEGGQACGINPATGSQSVAVILTTCKNWENRHKLGLGASPTSPMSLLTVQHRAFLIIFIRYHVVRVVHDRREAQSAWRHQRAHLWRPGDGQVSVPQVRPGHRVPCCLHHWSGCVGRRLDRVRPAQPRVTRVDAGSWCSGPRRQRNLSYWRVWQGLLCSLLVLLLCTSHPMFCFNCELFIYNCHTTLFRVTNCFDSVLPFCVSSVVVDSV